MFIAKESHQSHSTKENTSVAYNFYFRSVKYGCKTSPRPWLISIYNIHNILLQWLMNGQILKQMVGNDGWWRKISHQNVNLRSQTHRKLYTCLNIKHQVRKRTQHHTIAHNFYLGMWMNHFFIRKYHGHFNNMSTIGPKVKKIGKRHMCHRHKTFSTSKSCVGG